MWLLEPLADELEELDEPDDELDDELDELVLQLEGLGVTSDECRARRPVAARRPTVSIGRRAIRGRHPAVRRPIGDVAETEAMVLATSRWRWSSPRAVTTRRSDPAPRPSPLGPSTRRRATRSGCPHDERHVVGGVVGGLRVEAAAGTRRRAPRHPPAPPSRWRDPAVETTPLPRSEGVVRAGEVVGSSVPSRPRPPSPGCAEARWDQAPAVPTLARRSVPARLGAP